MKHFDPFVVGGLTLLVLAAFVAIMRVAVVVPHELCPIDRCTLIDWLGALSGWAGFLAALIGAILISRQIAEQRRQTEFLVGDSNPTVELAQPAKADRSIAFQLVNWNRRNITLHGVRVAAASHAFKCPQPVLIKFSNVSGSDLTWKDAHVDQEGMLDIGQSLLGWIDRQSHPPAW